MHRSWSAALLVASFWLAPVMATSADSQDALDQARALLQKNDGQGAAVLLEEALAAEPSQREVILGLLRQAYERAAKQAEAAGDRAGAETFRDNLEILNHKPRSKSKSESEPTPKLDGGNELAPTDPAIAKATAPSQEPTSPASLATPEAVPNSETAALPSGSTPPAALTPLEEIPPAVVPPTSASASDSASTSQASTSPALAPLQTPVSAPSPSAPIAAMPQPQAPAQKTPEVNLVAADAAFTSKRYTEACRLYMALAQMGKLPASRRDHLAYCRCAEVVRRINARPNSAAEWKSIDTEIQQIRKMSPNNWYAEYLRNLASERSPASRNRPSQKVVVRGSAPEERPVGGLRLPAGTPVLPTPKTPAPLEPASNPAPSAEPTSAPAPLPAPAPDDPGPTVVSQWQVRETANFRILHTDPDLAEQVAEVVEATREEQVKRWNGSTGRGGWTPRCDVYVYPTRTTFSRMTGQNPESPGFSTMGMNGGRIVNRRINVRADHPNLVAAILPHEVTHVVLADLFPQKQIPRWADEGMAVLSEPTSEQQLRAQDLEKPLSSGQLFKLHELMVMDYPDGKFWSLYYAQSVSLTRFLVEQGSPAQFVKFVQGTQRNGYETELKRIYQIDGFDDLEERWLAYARTKSADLAATRLGKASDTTNR